MKYLLKTEFCAVILLVMCSGISAADDQASTDEVSAEVDIQACFNLEYETEEMTSATAFTIAQCFTGLANSIVESQSEEFVADTELWVWDDKNVLLHYADSWYSFAKDKGHPNAQEKLIQTRQALKD